jgi:hypothetical protein
MTPIPKGKSTCSPVSSRCVVWEGPDIPCINLCRGDSIDDVIAKMAMVLCDSAGTSIDITSMTLSCLLTEGETAPDDIVTILQKVINKTCTLEEAIASLETNGSDPVIALPVSLHYDNLTGDHIEQLPQTEYSFHLAVLIAGLIDTINTLTTTLTGYGTRLGAAETAIAAFAQADVLLVRLQCLADPGTDLALDAAIILIEDAVCDITSSLGTVSAVNAAVALQCAGLTTSARLSGSGAMSSTPGWKPNPLTVADSLGNLWLTICDMRSKVSGIATQVAATCSDYILDFVATLSSDRKTLTIATNGKTIIPTGFVVCDGTFPILNIFDGVQTKNVSMENFVDLTKIGGTKIINLDNLGVNFVNPLILTLSACMTTPTGASCGKEKMITILNECVKLALISTSSVSAETTANVAWVRPISDAIIGYTLKLTANPLTAPILVGTYGVSTMSNMNFTALTAGTPYSVEIIVRYACGDSPSVTTSFMTTAVGTGDVLPDSFDSYTVTITEMIGHPIPDNIVVTMTFGWISSDGTPMSTSIQKGGAGAAVTMLDSANMDCLKDSGGPYLISSDADTTLDIGFSIVKN